MGPGFMGPPMGKDPRTLNEKLKEPKPKSIKEVPGYLYRVSKSLLSRLFYIFKIVYQTKPWILFVMVFMSVFNGVMPIVSVRITSNLLNSLQVGLNSKIMTPIYFGLAWKFGYLIINNMVNTIYNILYRISGELVTNNIKIKIMEKAKEVDLSSFDKPEFYERLENANREAGMRPIQIMSSTFSIVSAVITFVTAIITLTKLMPLAPIAMIIVSVPGAIINFIYRKKNFLYMRRRSVDRRQMNYYSDVMVNKDMVKEVRLFSLSDVFIGKFKAVFEKYFKGIKKLIYAEGFWNIGIMLVSTAVNCVLYIIIAKQVVTTGSPIGDFNTYVGALELIASSVSTLISTTATIYEGTLFIDNLIAFLNEKIGIVALLGDKAPIVNRHCGHTIKFENVCFRYPGSDHDVLHNINIELCPGDTCVLVGLNGAGKTTLIKLLTRLYDPTAGTIYLDGQDIRNYNVTELYKIFGIIFQDFGKYAFSVTDNIAFGQIEKPVNDEDIHYAAKQSSAEAFISNLPQGYDTQLMKYFYEDGTELSIGQWQKLSIARAFYSDSDILILDEPTASLDAIAEQEIFNQFDSLRKDKTTVFVSHRLSSATVANKIIVLENGSVVETGNHKELMDLRGKYYNLFYTQAKRYISSENEQVNLGEKKEKDNKDFPAMDAFPPRGDFQPKEGFPPRGEFPPKGDFQPREGFPPRGEFPPKGDFQPRNEFPKDGESGENQPRKFEE